MTQLWRPAASLENLRRRAEILASVRRFFAERGVLEVETPVLIGSAAADPNLASFSVPYSGPGAPASGRLWLQTSPEFAMKRLLAAGSGCIYQICRVFRPDERGRRHNPEFTMLEWYRLGYDHHRLMAEVTELVSVILGPRPVEVLSYREAFRRFAAIDPFQCATAELKARAAAQSIPLPALADDDRDGWLDLLFSELVSPRLGQGTFSYVCDFPASQAALARLRMDGEVEVAERFELFIDGMEIANGYHELTDPAEQRRRFERERARRQAAGQPESGVDERLLAALAAGLPACAGVALGLDRLVMVAVGASHIDEVMAFPIERC
ncbi:MAG: EF-P lysine aminoacylase GenX [Xanthomonadaceae bacterium]|nr:EF-P lysine aminoacylase GenX [Xanthomonadaceae bacterium]